jgi:hypothetical protein
LCAGAFIEQRGTFEQFQRFKAGEQFLRDGAGEEQACFLFYAFPPGETSNPLAAVLPRRYAAARWYGELP